MINISNSLYIKCSSAHNRNELNLRNNDLGNKSDAELAEAFAAIPANIIMLDLSRNKLGDKTSAELTKAFASIPDNVTTLDLDSNKLGNKNGVGLAEAFKAIPANITTLNLRWNFLDNKTSAELAEVFVPIIDKITFDIDTNVILYKYFPDLMLMAQLKKLDIVMIFYVIIILILALI